MSLATYSISAMSKLEIDATKRPQAVCGRCQHIVRAIDHGDQYEFKCAAPCSHTWHLWKAAITDPYAYMGT